LVLKHPTQPLDHGVSIRMLILLLQIRGHGGEHQTTDVKWVIAVLLISSAFSSICIVREIIRICLLKNILLFLLSENNSHFAVPINKVCSIQLLFLKNRSQIENGIVTGRHDLKH
jgi:hypothetical protein